MQNAPAEIPALSAADKARFFSKIAQRGPDECWPWLAGTADGYGVFNLHGKTFRAHRLAFLLTGLRITSEKPFALHRCDNRACCNPRHLFFGTHDDNALDRNAKGRQAKGLRHGIAKLTASQVLKIRAAYVPRVVTMKILAAQFCVSAPIIHAVIHRRNWRHV